MRTASLPVSRRLPNPQKTCREMNAQSISLFSFVPAFEQGSLAWTKKMLTGACSERFSPFGTKRPVSSFRSPLLAEQGTCREKASLPWAETWSWQPCPRHRYWLHQGFRRRGRRLHNGKALPRLVLIALMAEPGILLMVCLCRLTPYKNIHTKVLELTTGTRFATITRNVIKNSSLPSGKDTPREEGRD